MTVAVDREMISRFNFDEDGSRHAYGKYVLYADHIAKVEAAWSEGMDDCYRNMVLGMVEQDLAQREKVNGWLRQRREADRNQVGQISKLELGEG
jgi:hypothetical protein